MNCFIFIICKFEYPYLYDNAEGFVFQKPHRKYIRPIFIHTISYRYDKLLKMQFSAENRNILIFPKQVSNILRTLEMVQCILWENVQKIYLIKIPLFAFLAVLKRYKSKCICIRVCSIYYDW